MRKNYAQKFLSLHTHKEKNVKTCSDQRTTRLYKESASNEYSILIYAQNRARTLIFLVMGLNQALKETGTKLG